jgi:hypothetical protein
MKMTLKYLDEIIYKKISNILNSESIDKYSIWKRKNVTYRGIKEIGKENSNSSFLGKGLYSTPLSNKTMAKKYGKVYFVINAIPKKPKIFNSVNDWEIFLYNKLIFPYSQANGNDFPDKRDFDEKTTIKDEMIKMGYDGIIIKGREMVNYTPQNIKYFTTETELIQYYESKI